MELTNSKPFEQPDAGTFIGTLIDFVNMPNVQSSRGHKNKVRLLWALNNLNGTPVLDSEGKPLTVAYIKPASFHEKSDLYKMTAMILNGPPPLLTKTEELEVLLLGRSNVLFLSKVPNETRPGEFYTNVIGATPLSPGMIAPQVPAGFVRAKDKPKTQAGPYGQPVQTFAQAPAVQVAPAATASAPTSEQIAAYLAAQATANAAPAAAPKTPKEF